MTDISDEKLASAFGVSTQLLSFIPELLDDLWELGGSSRIMTDILRPLNLPPDSTRVLDLACGKGAASITIARELGFRVTGVDIFPPFIQDAKKLARKNGVEELCQFRIADAQKAVLEADDFNIVLLASAINVFGSLDRCIADMRRCIKNGGHMVIDSGFLKDENRSFGLFVTHDASHRQLQKHGDKIVDEILRSEEDIKEVCDSYLNALKSKVEKIAAIQPKVAEELTQYIRSQEEVSEAMIKRTTGVVWLIRKTE